MRVAIILPTMMKSFEIISRSIESLSDNVLELKKGFSLSDVTLVLIMNRCSNEKLKQMNNLLNKYKTVFNDTVKLCIPKNLGYAPSIYLGYQNVKDKADYFIIMNDDVVLPFNDILLRILRFMEQNPKIAAVSPKLRRLEDALRFDYAGAGGFYTDVLLVPFARGRLHDILLYDKEDSGISRALSYDVFMPSGAFYVARNIPENIPDPILFIMGEETDIGIKGLCMGYVYAIDSSIYVLHKGSLTIGSIFNPMRFYFYFRNRPLLVIKYASLIYLLASLLGMLLHDLLVALYLSLRNKSIMVTFIMAWFNLLKKLKALLRRRVNRYYKCYDILVKQNKMLKVPITLHYILLRIKYRKLWRTRSRIIMN